MLVNMKELLSVAHTSDFAVPAFNVSSSMILRGVIEESERLQAPVIIAIHPEELEFVTPEFMAYVKEAAQKASVPVCIHLDHGSTFEEIMEAIRYGFTSVMIDASSASFQDNVAICKKVVEVAAPLSISVEGELGTIGMADSAGEAGADEIIYTKPEDVKRFAELTGVDSLAIAIGTSHGIYPKNKKPELKLDLLQEIKAISPIPLVLHGGSSNSDKEIAKAVELGISKINISSDIKDAFYQHCRKVLQDPVIREPNAIYPSCIEAMKKVVAYKIQLFQAHGKARLYAR